MRNRKIPRNEASRIESIYRVERTDRPRIDRAAKLHEEMSKEKCTRVILSR